MSQCVENGWCYDLPDGVAQNSIGRVEISSSSFVTMMMARYLISGTTSRMTLVLVWDRGCFEVERSVRLVSSTTREEGCWSGWEMGRDQLSCTLLAERF